ncbi:MAG: hypothetical protein Kow0065_22110 [Methylomicrobium sp.]
MDWDFAKVLTNETDFALLHTPAIAAKTSNEPEEAIHWNEPGMSES